MGTVPKKLALSLERIAPADTPWTPGSSLAQFLGTRHLPTSCFPTPRLPHTEQTCEKVTSGWDGVEERCPVALQTCPVNKYA